MSQPNFVYPHRDDGDEPGLCFHCGEIRTVRCVYEDERDSGHMCCTYCTASHHGKAPLWDSGIGALEDLAETEEEQS